MAFRSLEGSRAAAMSNELGVARRTLERWCAWWRGGFLKSDLWTILKSRFVPPLDAQEMPRSLFDRILVAGEDRVVAMLRLVAPWGVTTSMMQRIMRSSFPF